MDGLFATYAELLPALTGHLAQVEVTYELFSRDGRPIRASVNLTLEATPQQPGRRRKLRHSGAL